MVSALFESVTQVDNLSERCSLPRDLLPREVLLNPGSRLVSKNADAGVLPTESLILESGLWLGRTVNIPYRILIYSQTEP